MNQKILVTGARGYLGGRLVQYLTSSGKTVVGTTRRETAQSPEPDGWPEYVPLVSLDPVADPATTKTVLNGIDCIYHLSAANAARSSCHPDAALFETATGTRRLIEAAILAGVKRFIFLSPIQVYGPLVGNVTEDSVPRPTNSYAITHLAGEHFALAASSRINVSVVRLANGTGNPAWLDGDLWSSIGNDFAFQAVNTGNIVVNAPDQWRDFIALEDVCRALSILSEKGSGILNLSSGKARRLGDFAMLTAKIASHMMGKEVVVPGPNIIAKHPIQCPFYISTEKFAAIGFTPSDDKLLESEQAITIRMLLNRKG